MRVWMYVRVCVREIACESECVCDRPRPSLVSMSVCRYVCYKKNDKRNTSKIKDLQWDVKGIMTYAVLCAVYAIEGIYDICFISLIEHKFLINTLKCLKPSRNITHRTKSQITSHV